MPVITGQHKGDSEMGKLKLLAIGEVMAEIRKSESGFAVNFAGDTFNTAIYAQRHMPQPQSVGYMTRIGTDPLSSGLLTMAQEEQLACDMIAKDNSLNIGIYSVTTDALGERSFHYWRSQSAARRLFTIEETGQFFPEADIIYLSGITLAILTPVGRERLCDVLQEQRKKGALIAFDSNYRPALWEDAKTAREVMTQIWNMTDIALPSIDDEMALYGDVHEQDVIDRFASLNCRHIAIKRGTRGPISPHLTAAEHPLFAPASNVVDTTAAGDSFNGGYLAALLSGKDNADCLLAGHELAAKVVGAPGAIMKA